jgi:membrane dipeptidase
MTAFSRPVSDEALEIHRASIVIDATSFFIEGHSEQLRQGGLTALNLTVPDTEDDAGGAIIKIAELYEIAERDPKLKVAFTVADIVTAKEEDNVALIIGAQNSRHMASKPGLVEAFYRLGLRVSQLAYNDRSFAADGCATGADAGLSEEGRHLVAEMNRLGMVVDLSHVGERSAKEAAKITSKPLICSHSNPRSMGANVPRNIDDDLIRAIAEKDGVVGLSPFPALVWRGDETRPSIEQYLESMRYVIDLVGIDHVGIGTDKVATPGAYPRAIRLRGRRRFASATGGASKMFDNADGSPELDGFKSLADMPVITQGLVSLGYGADEIRKVLGLNFLRVFENNWT